MNEKMDSFEKNGLEKIKYDVTDKMESMNKYFKSSVKPENGMFGITEIDKGNGLIEQLSRNEYGKIRKDYFQDGNHTLRREKIGDNTWLKTYYDDNGNAYKFDKVTWGKDIPKSVESNLKPNTEIVKSNITIETDSLGRPVSNSITDLEIKSGRESMKTKRTEDYHENDERGHLIADNFGGTSTSDNVVPQAKEVNHGKMTEIENSIRQLKEEGHSVDYKIKSNYADNSTRPSSFNYEIVSDGKVVDKGKFYNEAETTRFEAFKTSAKEGINKYKNSVAHHNAKSAGLEAAIVTGAMSTVDNVSEFMNGEISAEEMVLDIAKETGSAYAIGYGTEFISTTVATAMKESSHELLRTVGKTSIPTAVISFGIESYDSIVGFATGEINGQELAYDLGENAVGVAGSIGGPMLVGMALGSVIPGPGTLVGAGIGLVSGMVGYAVTTSAYETVVETVAEHSGEIVEGAHYVADVTIDALSETTEFIGDKATEVLDNAKEVSDSVTESIADSVEMVADIGKEAVDGVQVIADQASDVGKELLDKAENIATKTIDAAAEFGEEAVNDVKNAINNFNIQNLIPLHFA